MDVKEFRKLVREVQNLTPGQRKDLIKILLELEKVLSQAEKSHLLDLSAVTRHHDPANALVPDTSAPPVVFSEG